MDDLTILTNAISTHAWGVLAAEAQAVEFANRTELQILATTCSTEEV